MNTKFGIHERIFSLLYLFQVIPYHAYMSLDFVSIMILIPKNRYVWVIWFVLCVSDKINGWDQLNGNLISTQHSHDVPALYIGTQ